MDNSPSSPTPTSFKALEQLLEQTVLVGAHTYSQDIIDTDTPTKTLFESSSGAFESELKELEVGKMVPGYPKQILRSVFLTHSKKKDPFYHDFGQKSKSATRARSRPCARANAWARPGVHVRARVGAQARVCAAARIMRVHARARA